MKIKVGTKITVVNPGKNLPKFIRCYVTKITDRFIQAYDPVRDFSWGWKLPANIQRVMFH